MLLYVAGPYGSKTKKNGLDGGHSDGVAENIEAARKVAAELWVLGHAVICPHANTAFFEQYTRDKIGHKEYLEGDFNMIARCDGMVMMPAWAESMGATMEKEYAESLGMPVWVYPDVPALSRAEETSPQQCRAFREVLGQMYRTHLSKSSDYSPANSLLTGEPGVVTRLWDKTARLLNLTGFRFQALLHEGFESPQKPKHEAIDDTYLDLAVYAIIGLLVRRGRWGK